MNRLKGLKNDMTKENQSNNEMQLIYAQEEFPNVTQKSIFLAGPTPRTNFVESWRPEGLNLLKELNFDGIVYIPECRDGQKYYNYDAQINWEKAAMERADIILFWIPRKMDTLENYLLNDVKLSKESDEFKDLSIDSLSQPIMGALTTNLELSRWYKSGKVVVGYPDDAEHVKYITELIKEENLVPFSTLEDTIKRAIELIGEGAYRIGCETLISLNIWNTSSFQTWWKNQKSVGNEIKDCRFEYMYKPAPKKDFIFMWILYMQIYVKSEDRVKGNELCIARPNISSILLYLPNEDIMKTKILLIKEYRNCANNEESFVYELIGGSAKTTSDPIIVAQEEIKEETNLDINKDRIKYEGSRQLMATFSIHKSHLFSVRLTDADIPMIEEQMKYTHGVEDDTEKTYLVLKDLKTILSEQLVDWSNIGMILSVLNKK